jgi:hypothetical protein
MRLPRRWPSRFPCYIPFPTASCDTRRGLNLDTSSFTSAIMQQARVPSRDLVAASIHCSVVQVRPTWVSMNRTARKFAQRSSAVSTSRTRTPWSTRPSRRSRMTSRCRALAGSTVCLHRGGDHERGHSEVASSDARPIQPGPATAGSYLLNVNPCSRMSEMAVSQAAAS